MYVRPGHRRKGIATTLLAAVERDARRRNADQVIVLTGERNRMGQRLYSCAGYRGTRKVVYTRMLARPARLAITRRAAQTKPKKPCIVPAIVLSSDPFRGMPKTRRGRWMPPQHHPIAFGRCSA